MTRQIKWFEPLGGGMNQRVKASQINWNEAKELYNITHDKLGTWRSRKGRELLGTTTGDGGVDGLAEYRQLNGVNVLIKAVDGGLKSYSSGSFTTLDASVYTSGFKVNFVNFLNRLYIFSEQDNLQYWDGTDIVTVGAGGNEIQSDFGIVAQNTLWVKGGTGNEDTVYASLFDVGNAVPTDQLYEDDENITTSTRKFVLDGAITGMMSFKDTAYAFTKKSLWGMDVRSIGTVRGATKILDIGCTSHRSIAVDPKLGIAMWADGRNGRYMWTGAGDPINTVDLLVNRTEDNGVIDLISSSMFEDETATIWDGKYYDALGTLTDTTKEYYQNAGIVYDIALGRYAMRSIDASVLTTWGDDEGELQLVAGSGATKSVFKLETGTRDQRSDSEQINYDSYVKTKDFGPEFGPAGSLKTFHNLHLVYTGTGAIEISYALDGASEYTPITTAPIADSSRDRDTRLIPLPSGLNGHTISFEFRVTSGTMEIIGLGMDVTTQDTVGSRPV